jgi:hypothetical protein
VSSDRGEDIDPEPHAWRSDAIPPTILHFGRFSRHFDFRDFNNLPSGVRGTGGHGGVHSLPGEVLESTFATQRCHKVAGAGGPPFLLVS